MPLINKLNETKLRSVSYGSNKPYITTDVVTGKIDTGRVPLVDTVLNIIPKQINILGTKVDIKNSKPMSGVVDASRIGNFLLDLSTGPSFTVKQMALQKMNTIPNGGNVTARNPFSDSTSLFGKIARATVNVFNKLSPDSGQLYSPTNTLAQVALQGVGLHTDRAGLFPLTGATRYEDLETNNLLNLKNKFHKNVVGTALSEGKLTNMASGILSNFPILKRIIPLSIVGNETLFSYQGGPESLGGLGVTNITRAQIKPGIYTLEGAIQQTHSAFKNTWDIYSESDAIKNAYSERLADGAKDEYIQKSKFSSLVSNPRVPFNLFKPSTTNNQAAGASIYNSNVGELKYTNYLGETVTVKANNNKIANASREIRIGSGRKDAINLTPLFTGSTSANNSLVKIGNDHYNIRDLIKFRIESIDNTTGASTFMVFRSYLTNFDDNITADWNNFKYVGRGENLYTYSGFGRSVSIGFKVAALSEMEMQPMYQKLNYLASSMMPDYTGGYMKGNFFKMTVGNYFYRQIGIITNLSYKVSNDTPWEIAIDEPEGGTAAERKLYELPHIIDVSLTFIPIGLQNNGDNMIPEKGVNSPVMLQGDTNPWVKGAKVGSGEGVTFASYGANYVGSDAEKTIDPKNLNANIVKREVTLYDTSTLKMLDPNKLTPLNLQPASNQQVALNGYAEEDNRPI